MTADERAGAVIERLEEEGLFVKAEDYTHAVSTCYRCGTTIEPLLSLQWFMDMKRLAAAGHRRGGGRPGEVRPRPLGRGLPGLDAQHPALVRQPAAVVGAPHPRVLLRGLRPHHGRGGRHAERCDKCGGPVRHEEDVLDTWFSSQLWPFATLGWPEETRPAARPSIPPSVLSTARDIIYLWVARMIMMGLEFMGDVPFRDVIIHPTVLAADGRRMSKSLGTGVDPLELIAEYGADATRFGLAYMSSVQDVRFSAERIEMGRNFANKIWNASRLVLQGADPEAGSAEGGPRSTGHSRRPLDLQPPGGRRRRGGRPLRGLRVRRRRPAAVPLRLERAVRLVSGGGEDPPLQRRRGGARCR